MQLSDKEMGILIVGLSLVVICLAVMVYTQNEGFHELCTNYCSVQGAHIWKYSAYSCGCAFFENHSNWTIVGVSNVTPTLNTPYATIAPLP